MAQTSLEKKIKSWPEKIEIVQDVVHVLYTVKFEIFARILFSWMALKNIFAKLKLRGLGMIYLYQ